MKVETGVCAWMCELVAGSAIALSLVRCVFFSVAAKNEVGAASGRALRRGCETADRALERVLDIDRCTR